MAAVGAVDELNAALGMARVLLRCPVRLAVIDRVQEILVGLMGELATLPEDREKYLAKGYPVVREDDVRWVEGECRTREAGGVKFSGWARPGAEGSEEKAALDFARTVARRAEREVWRLAAAEPVAEPVKLFFNRVSDLCWIMAREKGGDG